MKSERASSHLPSLEVAPAEDRLVQAGLARGALEQLKQDRQRSKRQVTDTIREARRAAGSCRRVFQRRLGHISLSHLLLVGVLGDEAVHHHVLGLPDTVAPRHVLQVVLRVPGWADPGADRARDG